MTSTGTQLSLFDDSSTDQSESPALVEPIASSPTQAQAGVAPIDQARKSEVKLTPRSTLSAAMEAYLDHIQGSELSPHTVKSFMYDLNILAEFATPARPIGPDVFVMRHLWREGVAAGCRSSKGQVPGNA